MVQIPDGAVFQLAEYVPDGGSQASGRRRLMMDWPEPQVVADNQVSVTLPSVGGYYYLTGGEAPVVTIVTGAFLHCRTLLRFGRNEATSYFNFERNRRFCWKVRLGSTAHCTCRDAGAPCRQQWARACGLHGDGRRRRGRAIRLHRRPARVPAIPEAAADRVPWQRRSRHVYYYRGRLRLVGVGGHSFGLE